MCEKCGYTSISKLRMDSHRYNQHETEKHKKCPHCDYTASSSSKILFHIDNIHPETGEKQYKCDNCQATFIYKQTYVDHTKFKCKFSSYVRPGKANEKISCEYCDEVFSSDYWAKNHYKYQHPGKDIIIALVFNRYYFCY